MKFPTLLALLLLPLAAFGRDNANKATAYQALRVIGSERDQSILHRVIEVKGRTGAPQPATWTVIFDDPLARGGVREIEVSNGHISSERTPMKAYSGNAEEGVMNFQQLNLDSEGAFTIAEEAARDAKIGFDSVDYVLKCDGGKSAPTWVIELIDERQHSLGNITIAADTGAVVNKSFGGARFGAGAGVGTTTTTTTTTASTTARSGEEQTPTDDPDRRNNLGHKIDRNLHRVGATLEEFFTGRRTLDRRFDGE